MSDEKDDERTVFQPPSGGEKTGGFAPLGGEPAAPPASPPPSPPASPPHPQASPPASTAPPMPPLPPAPQQGGGQIAVGDTLNGIYRITRFIARGGMGEVYEGVNIHSAGERVAVKVMLANLASDELVMAMFAKEASTLTRLHHEAIVPYRLAARDPQGRPFIVTEYVDGPSLEQRLGSVRLSDDQFGELAKRLARGLGAAHALGAIHRDIAPDNILLVDGNPERPKIIDFGIARDAREQQQGTIVGDGFAGKLKYVAPEQLGEYGRNIGPWTDLYSLALTLLAVAAGRHSDMGGSIADAVRKRMSVPDLSPLPARYRSAFERALQPDPAQRPQSMGDFITLLYESEGPGGSGFMPLDERPRTIPPKPAAPSKPAFAERIGALSSAMTAKLPKGLPGGKWALLGGAGALVVLVGIVGLVLATSGNDDGAAPAARSTQRASASSSATIAPGSQQFAALAAGLAAQPACSWLSFDGADADTARFVGGAGNPAAAQSAVADGLAAKGAGGVSLDMGEVVSFNPSMCGAVNALREFRAAEPMMASPQRTYEAEKQPNPFSAESGAEDMIAKPLIRISGIGADEDILLIGIDAASHMTTLASGRGEVAGLIDGFQGSATGNSYELPYWTILETPPKQSYGIAVVAGKGPFPKDLFGDATKGQSTPLGADWPERFRTEARAKGWRTDIFWFAVTDQTPG